MSFKAEDESQSPKELKKEATLTKADKVNTILNNQIEAFNLLSWAALCALIISIWQIIIPFFLFKLNFAQLCLGFTSAFFLLESLIVLYWSNKNYNYLREHEKEETVVLHTYHIEGTVYITGFTLIACYVTFLVGIIMELGYSWSLLVAQGANPDTAYKQAVILVVAQCLMILGDIAILFVYVKSSYHLEFFPHHLPSVLGFFLTIFVLVSCLLLSDQDYIKSYVGEDQQVSIENASANHKKILYTTIIGILISIYFIIENRFSIIFTFRANQTQIMPKAKFYNFPFIVYTVIGLIVLSNSVEFIQNASQTNKVMKSNCKSTLQMYDSQFVQSIGCPNKYLTLQTSNEKIYSQDCPTQNTGIVWESDTDLLNIDKQNQLSCLNLNCCYVIGQVRSLKYKEFFLITLLYTLMGFICAGHSLDLAMQNGVDLKGSKSFSAGKLTFQLIITVAAIILAGFMALSYQPQVPQTNVPNNQLLQNFNAQNYTQDLPLASISACKYVDQLTRQNLLVEFNVKKCPIAIQSDLSVCNNSHYFIYLKLEIQGFSICLQGQNGVFQLDPQWDNDAKIDGLNMFNPYYLQQGLIGTRTSDTFCAYGLQDDINKILSHYLFFCQNPNKIPIISETQQQINIDSQKSFKEEEKENNRILLRKSEEKSKNIKIQEFDDQKQFDFVQDDEYAQITITLYDSEHASIIKEATIQLFQNDQKCQMVNQAVDFSIRTVHTNSEGSATINNILIVSGAKFMIQIKADGFYYNCVQLGELTSNQVVSKTVPLVSMMQQDQMMKVLLSYEDTTLDLELGATYNSGLKTQCYSGYYQQQCGGLSYSVSFENQLLQIQKPYQVITIDSMISTNYLFFVKLVPKDSELKNAINNNLELTEEQSKNLQALNQAFQEDNVQISLFGKNHLFPVGQYSLIKLAEVSQVLSNQYHETQKSPLVWLAVCLNGSIGPISQDQVRQFWTYGTSYWQRPSDSTISLPNSVICDSFFKQSDDEEL